MKIGETRWSLWGGVESETSVIGLPKDRLKQFKCDLTQELESISNDYECISVSEIKITREDSSTVDILIKWFTGGEDRLRAGDGEYSVRRVLTSSEYPQTSN